MTTSQLAAKHGIHRTVIGGWKRQAIEGLTSLFDAGEPAAKVVGEAEIEKLHAKIGQLPSCWWIGIFQTVCSWAESGPPPR